ncbi:hypothetical protein TrST_g9845 [Triparma strigata]|uniref:Lipid desaturase domain-containing protein n=2 Tax=Triparma TaxID=722752 RepID=A0A9W7ER17_9STRA|nr:hypothetical protein TrST_g9845 [Triparma strigata]
MKYVALIIVGTLCLASGFLTPLKYDSKVLSSLSLRRSSVNVPFCTSLKSATLPPPSSSKVKVSPSKSTDKSQDFVFGLSDDLVREKGRKTLVLEGDDLTTKPYQIILVWGTFLVQFLLSLSSLSTISSSHPLLSLPLTLTTLLLTYALSDLGSGIFHWSVDNYGNGSTPILGNIIAAFQGHHTAPWTITERGFENNVHKLCYPFGVALPLLSYLLGLRGIGLLSLTTFCFFEIMSQELHKWTHQTPKDTSSVINWLQKYNFVLSRRSHNKHHTMPFSGNYCIVNGWNNGWLDRSGFFRRLEKMVWEWKGVESNSWKLDGELKERTLRGEFRQEV